MINPADASAVVVTRGDVDLTAITNSLLDFDETIIWNNSERENAICYGRFLGAREARKDWIYVQDDDALVAHPALLRACEGHVNVIVASRPPTEPMRFVGVGAVFHKCLLDVFDRYIARYGVEYKDADSVFCYQNLYHPVWVGYAELEWSRWDDRMYKLPNRYAERDQVIRNIKEAGWLRPEV